MRPNWTRITCMLAALLPHLYHAHAYKHKLSSCSVHFNVFFLLCIQVDSAWKSGDSEKAHRSSRNAMKFNIAGIIGGITSGVAIGVFYGISVAASGSGSGSIQQSGSFNGWLWEHIVLLHNYYCKVLTSIFVHNKFIRTISQACDIILARLKKGHVIHIYNHNNFCFY